MSLDLAGERPGRERRNEALLALVAIAVTAFSLFVLVRLLGGGSDDPPVHDFATDRFTPDALAWLAAEDFDPRNIRCFRSDVELTRSDVAFWVPNVDLALGPEKVTRVSALEVLWIDAGAPTDSAIEWAVEIGITSSPDSFTADATIRQGEWITWLWRTNGSPRHSPAIDTACRADGSAAPPAGFPFSGTTGIAGAGLLVSDLTPSESLVIDEDGAVIELLDVAGSIRVVADNVTIRRSRIRHVGAFGIDVEGENLVVEDVLIVGIGEQTTASIGLSDFTCRRCDLSGSTDGAAAYADVVIEDSFIHDLRRSDGSHNDGIQGSGGSNVTIRHNSILGPFQTSTSAILAQTNIAPIDNWHIHENYLSGGSFSVYLRDKESGHGPPTNSSIEGNLFAAASTGVSSSCAESRSIEECSGIESFISASSAVRMAGNRLDDGQPLE